MNITINQNCKYRDHQWQKMSFPQLRNNCSPTDHWNRPPSDGHEKRNWYEVDTIVRGHLVMNKNVFPSNDMTMKLSLRHSALLFVKLQLSLFVWLIHYRNLTKTLIKWLYLFYNLLFCYSRFSFLPSFMNIPRQIYLHRIMSTAIWNTKSKQ